MSQRRIVILGLALVSVLMLLCGLAQVTGYFLRAPIHRTTSDLAAKVEDLIPPTPATHKALTESIPSTVEPPSEAAHQTEGLLRTDLIPPADPISLTQRFRKLSQVPRVLETTPKPYVMGSEETFWISNVDTAENQQVKTVLQYITPHLYLWVQEGESINLDRLKAAADTFENRIYPKDREFFGSEWTPGVDGDPHLFILHVHGLGRTVAGYFSSMDEYSPLVHPYSNGHEMFYINLDAPGVPEFGDYYDGLLAHEFQHMIHWHTHPNQDSWLNEGLSVLATTLNGYDSAGFDRSFLQHPNTQLNSWPVVPGSAAPNYGAGYLFSAYFLDQFGEQATRALVAGQGNGLNDVDAVLNQMRRNGNSPALYLPDSHQPRTADDVFTDWTVANLLDNWVDVDGLQADSRYHYSRLKLDAPVIAEQYRSYPVPWTERTVNQYGTDYIMLRSGRPVTVTFSGTPQVQVIDNQAHSGRFQFWSNRADSSDMTLTHTFDLSSVSTATLSYWAWYDLENGWDYAYVTASTDGGRTWDILHTRYGTSSNPSGNAYGWGYTGESGGAEQPHWVQDQVDLTPYAGKRDVLVRFEVVTDAEVNLQGFSVDDISLPESGYQTDFDADNGGWQAIGFVRLDNDLPEHFSVQLVAIDGGRTTVQHLNLDAQDQGRWSIPLGRGVDRAVLVISGETRGTTNPATYRYQVDGP